MSRKSKNSNFSRWFFAILALGLVAGLAWIFVFYGAGTSEQKDSTSQSQPSPAGQSNRPAPSLPVVSVPPIGGDDPPLIRVSTNTVQPPPQPAPVTNPPPVVVIVPAPPKTNAVVASTNRPDTSTNFAPSLTNLTSGSKSNALQSLPPAKFPLPQPASGTWPRPVSNVLELQIALARQSISPGSVDGVFGSQTRLALMAFQTREGLPVTGELDRMTRSNLFLAAPIEETYEITTNDLARLQPLSPTWLGKSQQTELAYETLLESLAERRRSSPVLLIRMNPGFDWTNAVAGKTVRLPALYPTVPKTPVSLIRIKLGARTLSAHDASGNLVAHFPCSIARRVDKRPVGTLRVVNIAAPPNYLFDPENFPESAEAKTIGRKIMIPPGPNNPVGTAWIGLDRPGYGIHGTPRPEEVGRTESHGCFRLANWNAEFLARCVRAGVIVEVEP